jgi:6-phosphogluconolactonase
VFHPHGGFAYLINELDSTIMSLEHEKSSGALEPVQTVPTLPDSFQGSSTCADIMVEPSGQFLYASNRGHNSIAIYRIDDQNGTLALVDHESTQGKTPRNFTIDPSGTFLFAANQDTDNIVCFRIDRRIGRLEPCGQFSAPTPVCLKILQT